jgi:hypothetical protein
MLVGGFVPKCVLAHTSEEYVRFYPPRLIQVRDLRYVGSGSEAEVRSKRLLSESRHSVAIPYIAQFG